MCVHTSSLFSLFSWNRHTNICTIYSKEITTTVTSTTAITNNNKVNANSGPRSVIQIVGQGRKYKHKLRRQDRYMKKPGPKTGNKIVDQVGKCKFGARGGKNKLGARAVKYKLGARAGKYRLGARTGKYKLGARVGKCIYEVRVGKYKLGVRAGVRGRGSQGQNRGPSKETGTRKYKHPIQSYSISRSSDKSISKVLKTLCDLRRLKYDLTLNHSTKEPVGFLASTVQVNN